MQPSHPGCIRKRKQTHQYGVSFYFRWRGPARLSSHAHELRVQTGRLGKKDKCTGDHLLFQIQFSKKSLTDSHQKFWILTSRRSYSKDLHLCDRFFSYAVSSTLQLKIKVAFWSNRLGVEKRRAANDQRLRPYELAKFENREQGRAAPGTRCVIVNAIRHVSYLYFHVLRLSNVCTSVKILFRNKQYSAFSASTVLSVFVGPLHAAVATAIIAT